MDWAPLWDDADAKDAPRNLSVEEINGVLSTLKWMDSPFTRASCVARNQFLQHVGRGLQEIQLCPSRLSDLVKRIEEMQVLNCSEPGYAMGITTGSALGSINTQTMLNTFKSSGAAETGSKEVQEKENLVYARPCAKTDHCTIHMLDKYTSMFRVVELTYEIDKFTVKDALSKDGVDHVIHDLPMNCRKEPWFISTQTSSFKEAFSRAGCIMELRLCPRELVVRNVTMADVAQAFQYNKIHVLWSDIDTAKLFVLPMVADTVTVEQLENRTLLKCFMIHILYGSLDSFYLKGIQGQSNSEPTVTKIPHFVKQCSQETEKDLERYSVDSESEKDLAELCSCNPWMNRWCESLAVEEGAAVEESKRTWKLTVDDHKMALQGIPVERIAECLLVSRVSNVRIRMEMLWGKVHAKNRRRLITCRSSRSPTELMSACMDYFQRRKRTSYDNPFVYVFLKSHGTNLSTICSLPFVDTTTSVCVNVHVMAKMFGIDVK